MAPLEVSTRLFRLRSTRVARGLSANVFGLVVTLVVQVASVPVFLSTVGVQAYGAWLVITAIPNYLTITDFGLAGAASTEATQLVAQDDRTEAGRLLRSMWICATIGSSAVLAAVLAGCWAFVPAGYFSGVDRADALAILGLQLGTIALWIQAGFVEAAFRADRQYGRGVTYFSVLRLADFLITAALLSSGRGLVTLAAGLLVGRIATTLLYYVSSIRRISWFRLGTSGARLSDARRLGGASVSYIGLNVGNVIAAQGYVILLGIISEPVSVVIFTTARTMANVIRQLTGVLNRSIQPELTIAIAQRARQRANRLMKALLGFASAVNVVCFAVLGLFGAAILSVWTHGSVHPPNGFLWLTFATILADVPWTVWSIVAISTNTHQRLAAVYVVAAISSLLLAWPLTKLLGLNGIPTSMFLIDVLVTPVAYFHARRILASFEFTPVG